jgi:hypothetical protein
LLDHPGGAKPILERTPLTGEADQQPRPERQHRRYEGQAAEEAFPWACPCPVACDYLNAQPTLPQCALVPADRQKDGISHKDKNWNNAL